LRGTNAFFFKPILAGDIVATNTLTLGGVTRTNWPEGGTGSGWTNDVVTLARDVKSRDAVGVGEYGAAFGYSTTAGYAGAAFGYGTTAGEFGAAFGSGTTAENYGAAFGDSTAAGEGGAAFGSYTTAGDYGFAAGYGASAGSYGFAAGESTTAGEHGFSAGRDAHGTTGSFVFADSAPVAFDRTNSPNSFSVRAAGGTYFDTPLFTVMGEVAVESNLVVGTGIVNGEAISNWDAAYGWGDHADAGYLTAETDSTALGQGFATTNAAGQIATNVASDWSRWVATNDIAFSNSTHEIVDMRLRGRAQEGGLAFYEGANDTFQTLGLGPDGEFWRFQIGDGLDSAFTGPSVPLWARSRDSAYNNENIARTNELFPMWMGGIWGDGIVSSNGTLAVESNLVVGTGIVNGEAISNWDAAYDWGDHAEAGYLTEEADAAALSAVAAVSGRVDTVEGWGDHGEAGYLTAEADAAALGAIGSATNALLDLAGTRAMTGNVVTLARDVKSRDAASVGEYGAAFGDNTTAGTCGAAFGVDTTAGNFGAAFGDSTTAGYAGAAFGVDTTAGNFGFSAGRYARGSTGSFVFADSASVDFDRTNSPNSFSVRAAGGTYFDTPLFTVTGEVAVESNLVVGNGQVFLNSSGTSWLQLDGTNIQFRATNGVTGRIQIIYE
jgi:hypothetical protein